MLKDVIKTPTIPVFLQNPEIEKVIYYFPFYCLIVFCELKKNLLCNAGNSKSSLLKQKQLVTLSAYLNLFFTIINN